MKNKPTGIGRYQHYKGGEYEVIAIATHTENAEKFVVYRALYAPYTVWVRPYDMFFEILAVENVEIPRFRKIG